MKAQVAGLRAAEQMGLIPLVAGTDYYGAMAAGLQLTDWSDSGCGSGCGSACAGASTPSELATAAAIARCSG